MLSVSNCSRPLSTPCRRKAAEAGDDSRCTARARETSWDNFGQLGHLHPCAWSVCLVLRCLRGRIRGRIGGSSTQAPYVASPLSSDSEILSGSAAVTIARQRIRLIDGALPCWS